MFFFMVGKKSIFPFTWHSLEALMSHVGSFLTYKFAFQYGIEMLRKIVITVATGSNISCISNISKKINKGQVDNVSIIYDIEQNLCHNKMHRFTTCIS